MNKFFLQSLWLVCLTSLSALIAGAAPITLHVSPRGNDSWSGKPSSPSRNHLDGPVATLQRAIELSRGQRPATILLRGGTYELSDTLLFGPEDSGSSAKQPLTIAAYRNEKPVLSAGRKIVGWRRTPSGIWEAEVPEVRAGTWYFRQLFVNGKRAQRARTPNEGFFRIQGPSPQDKPVKLRFAPGEIKKEWAADGHVEVIALLAWADFRYEIRQVDEVNHVATLSGDPRPSNREGNARYYIENTPDALDAPGEWYLERKAGILRYWPQPGEDPSKAEIIASRLDALVKFQGDLAAQRPVQHITLRGLTFAHTDWIMPENGYADTQAAVATRGDIWCEGASHISIENCTFKHLGGYAVEFGRACSSNRIVGNEMYDLGAGGIRLGEPVNRTEPFEQNHSHLVANNHIHHGGEVFPPAVGVFVMQSARNRIASNHIHHLYYTAISVGWTWGYRASNCHSNILEFNHLHDIGQSMLSDMGAVYTLGIQPGTVIRNNTIHDVSSFNYGGWGLYTDEGSTGILLESNVVYRCKSAGFHQHYGRDNILRHNIFAYNKEHQLMRTRNEDHNSFTFTNNTVIFDSGKLLGSNWQNDRYVLDDNHYVDTRLDSNPDGILFGTNTLSQWQARGHDLHPKRMLSRSFRLPRCSCQSPNRRVP